MRHHVWATQGASLQQAHEPDDPESTPAYAVPIAPPPTMTTTLTKSTGCRHRSRGKVTSAAGAKSDAPATRATPGPVAVRRQEHAGGEAGGTGADQQDGRHGGAARQQQRDARRGGRDRDDAMATVMASTG